VLVVMPVVQAVLLMPAVLLGEVQELFKRILITLET
jgi:hypothetical protein